MEVKIFLYAENNQTSSVASLTVDGIAEKVEFRLLLATLVLTDLSSLLVRMLFFLSL